METLVLKIGRIQNNKKGMNDSAWKKTRANRFAHKQSPETHTWPNMPAVDDILRQVILLLGGIFSVAWLVFAITLKRDPIAAALFSLANLLTGTGVWLVSLRDGTPSYFHYQCADWMVIAGFTSIWMAIQHTLRTRRRAGWITLFPLALDVLTTAAAAPEPSSYLLRACIFNGVACGLFGACFRDIYMGFSRTQLGPVHRSVIALPLLLCSMMFAGREIQLVMGALGAARPLHDPTMGYARFLWTFIALIAVTNVTLVITAVGNLMSSIQEMANRDPLTAIYNRRFVFESLRQALGQLQRTARPLSCVLMDVDHFKKVNDGHGHDVGDQALLHICRLFESDLRVSDVFGRYGGEEFILVCPDTDFTTAKNIAERLRMKLVDTPLHCKDTVLALTASFGVATANTTDTLESIVKRVDLALYQAKNSGRNQVCGESS